MKKPIIEEDPPITCTGCGDDVHWLDVFPGQVCINCHAAKVDKQTPQQLHDDIINGFSRPLK